MRAVELKKRLTGGYFGGKGLIEYEYANFDVKKALSDYEELYKRIVDLQLRLDLTNQTETFSVEMNDWIS